MDQACNWFDVDSGTSEQRATAMLAHAADIETRHQEQHENNLLYGQMYSNREMPSFDWGFGVASDTSLSAVSRLSENLGMSIVDTFVSQIGKMRPKASVVLKGAPWGLRKAAQRADRWLYATFLHLDIYSKGKQIFRDAAIFSFGCARVDLGAGNRLTVQRIFPDDVQIDNRECLSGQEPIHVFIRQVMTLSEARSRFNLEDDELRKAGGARYLAYRGHGPEHVVVVEGWRRAIRNEEGKLQPGYHMVAIEGKCISESKWTEEWLPLVFFHWEPATNGWYNPSVMERIFPYQLRLNEVNERIREAQDVMAVPRILVPIGAQLNVHQVTNEIGKFIRYSGPQKPEALNWSAASAEVYGERDRIVRSCYEFMGISQMSAQAKAPENARWDSSAAFREFSQIEQARFTDLSQRFEQFYLNLAKAVMRIMHKYGGRMKQEVRTYVQGRYKTRSQVIDWGQINLDDNNYFLTLDASSSMNQTPAARLDALEQMRARGEITAEEYQQHLLNPDLENLASLTTASAEDIDRVIDLLENEDYEAPSELQDLVMGLERVHKAYLGLRLWDDVPREVFENFEAWMLAAKSIVEPEPPDAQVPGQALSAGPMDPLAMGMGAPQPPAGTPMGPGMPQGMPGAMPAPGM